MITGAATVALRPLNLIASFLLLRYLSPEQFGTVAYAMLLFQTSNLFTGLGMGSAIIHTQLDRRQAAFQANTMMMLFAVLLTIPVFVFVEPIANLLTRPGDDTAVLIEVMRWLSLLIIINTSSTIPTALLRKDLQFGRVSIASLASQISYTLFALVFAILGYGVWSLVIGQIVSSLVKAVLSWWLCPDWQWLRPTRWDLSITRELLSYGMPTMWSGILTYFHSHWDDWLVGRVLGKTALGLYSKAYDLTNNTIKQFSQNVIGAVFFPSYAKMQDEPERLMRAYVKSVQLVMLIVVPLSLGVLAIAPEMVRVLWGINWVPMIPVLQIYAFMLMSRPISTNTSPLFMATGRPHFNARAGYVLLAVMVPLALLLLPYGILGVATAVVVSHFVGAAYNVYQVNTILPGSAGKTFQAMIPATFAGVLMLVGVLLVKDPVTAVFGERMGFPGLFAMIGVGGVIYAPIVFLFQRALFAEIWSLLWPMFQKRVPFIRSWAQKRAA